LAPFDLGTRQSDTGTLVTLQLSVPSLKPRDIHTTKDKALSGEQILHSDLAQIHEDLRPIGVRTRTEATVPHVRPWLTPLVHARSRTALPNARSRALAVPQPPVHRAVPIKQPRASAIPPCALTSPARAKDHRNSPRARRATARQAF
jgi:hypothetical protein